MREPPETAARGAADRRPLIAHVLYRFDTGGLENGLVNLVNRLPHERFRHAIVALDRIEPSFASRVLRPDVHFAALHKAPGPTARELPRLWRLFRQIRPDIVHTRNLGAIDSQIAAWAAGVPVRLHGEHGRDVGDLDGCNRRNLWNRRLLRPLIHRWVALSRDLEGTLTGPVGVPPSRITRICNGVDDERFRPREGPRPALPGLPFSNRDAWLIGAVGRMQSVKNQTALAEAFARLLARVPGLRGHVRLVLVGDGPLRQGAQQILANAGLAELAWLPGERADVPEVLRALDCFVLPSLAEGISNTILEAMASGLPVIATDVGGNAELVTPLRTGVLVPAGDVEALSLALQQMALDPDAARAMGRAGRGEVERRFSLQAMVQAYHDLYVQALAGAGRTGRDG